MTRVMLRAEMQKVLLDFSTPLELCDESGIVRAKLIPCVAEEANEWIDLTADISDEQIEREIELGESYSTEELIAEIRKKRAG